MLYPLYWLISRCYCHCCRLNGHIGWNGSDMTHVFAFMADGIATGSIVYFILVLSSAIGCVLAIFCSHLEILSASSAYFKCWVRSECDITYAYILDNFNFNFNSNSKCSHIYKFKYQSMFDHYADHHMSKSYVVILMHNSKMYRITKETIIHNSDTLM